MDTEEGKPLDKQEAPLRLYKRNFALLAIIYMVYFGLRSGCLIVLPLACRAVLRDELADAVYSPLYQLPLALWLLIDICLSGPWAVFMERHGRRAGFSLGAGSCFFGNIGAFLVLRLPGRHFSPWLVYALLNLSIAMIAPIGVGDFVRYAAAEVAPKEKRSMAVSLVIMFGGVMSAVGPVSASLASMLDAGEEEEQLHGYANFFLFTAGFCVIAAIAARCLKMPSQSGETPAVAAGSSVNSVKFRNIIQRPSVFTAVFSQLVVQLVMVVPMSGVSLAMHNTLGLEVADWTISGCVMLHTLFMFVTGVISGPLADRLGVHFTVVAGLLTQAVSLAIGALNHNILCFYASLALNGLGWNLAFIAGTLLLLRSHAPEEKSRMTGANEALRATANALATLLSSTLEWNLLLCICSAFVTLGIAVISLHWRLASGRGPAQAAGGKA